MAPKNATSSLVEQLAEVEQHLVERTGAGSGVNSGAASEERDSVIEGGAEQPARSTSAGGDARSTRSTSEVGSDGSRRPYPRRSGAEDSPAGSGSAVTSSHPSRSSSIAASRDDEEAGQPPMQPSALWQRLKDTQEAKRVVDVKLLQAQEAIESMREKQERECAQLKKQIDGGGVAAANDLLNQRKKLSREHKLLKRQLQLSQELVKNAGDENAVMRRSVQAVQKSHADEVADLKGRLDHESKSKDVNERERLLRQLDTSRAEQREMVAELAEMHLKMLNADKLRHIEVGDLKMMLDSASHELEMVEHGGGAASASAAGRIVSKQALVKRCKAPPRRGPAPPGKLDVIEEDLDDEDLASLPDSASGFNVSSDAEGEGVGDMRDFDEDELLEMVIKENAQTKREIKDLQTAAARRMQDEQDLAAHVAAREAEYESKIKRLMEQLDISHKVHGLTSEDLELLRGLAQSPQAAARSPQLAKLKDLLETSEGERKKDTEEAPIPAQPAEPRVSQKKDPEYQELREQINTLKEANRIAEARAEDLKHALSAEEKKHLAEVGELKRRVAGSSGEKDEAEVLRKRLKGTEEDKNMLANTLECKELQWKTQTENLQLELEEVKREMESASSRFQSDVAQLEASAHEASERRSKASREHAAALQQSASAFSLSLLRCPLRYSVVGDTRPMYCQDATWNVISAISGLVVLWCKMSDYTIQQASQEASRIWSSSMLKGRSFFSLATAPSSVTWLKKAFSSHQRIADADRPGMPGCGPPGFIVRDLGCESFTNKSGESFDSSVSTAHFPAEVGRPSSLLVILEPQGRAARGSSVPSSAAGGQVRKAHSRSSMGPRGASPSGGTGSSISEASASSVSPSDSASNVLGFRGA